MVVLLGVAFSAAVFGFGGSAAVSNDPSDTLPRGAESTEVAVRAASLPGSDVTPAVVVFSRDGTLTGKDQRAIAEARARFPTPAVEGEVGPPIPSADRKAVLVLVPLTEDLDDAELKEAVNDLRAQARTDLPAGLTVEVTGAAGFAVDLSSVFDGANFTLLGATALVVALLLLVTYRSPWLWLVPLGVVGVADQVAAKLCNWLSRTTDLRIDEATLGITSVLVFGAGTNYALLLIARYREELRRIEDRHLAMRRALRSAAPAIAASSSTVIISLLTLLLADSPFVSSIGWAGAVGIFTALVYALVLLPAVLVLFGRRLFWPFAPRVGQGDPTENGVWARVGRSVVRRPVAVVLAGAVLLGGLTFGLSGLRVGLSQTEQFRERVEAIAGQETVAEHFPGGTSQPTVVITDRAQAEQVATAAAGVAGVDSARVTDQDADLAQIEVVLQPAPGTPESRDLVRTLRRELDAVDREALVGGAEAQAVDERATAERDRLLVGPLILGVVFVVLIALLRSLVAAVLLVLTVVATYAASMGASWFAFDRFFDFPALDLAVPLLAFLFLVALGVDYNIFLTTRAREETPALGVRDGIVRGLAVTGGVITSAGVLLAAVFTVLGVLPLITLTQIGVVVGFGVLLDTLLVRSVLVPALVSLTGRAFWWPSALSRAPEPATPPAADPAADAPEPERAGRALTHERLSARSPRGTHSSIEAPPAQGAPTEERVPGGRRRTREPRTAGQSGARVGVQQAIT